MRRAVLHVALAVLLLAAAAPAWATSSSDTTTAPGALRPGELPTPDPVSPVVYPPASQTVPPPTFRVSARRAVQLADRTAEVRKARSHHPDLTGVAYVSPLKLRSGTFYHWEVLYNSGQKLLVEVDLDRNGRVLETQTAPDVGWGILRGYPGVLGGRLNAPYIWLPLCLLFLLPFLDPRRPFRLLHLDLAMLLAFGLSHWFFARGRPDISVPLAYPFLVYAAVRLLTAAYRPRRRAGALAPSFSTRTLTVVLVVLVALRIAFGLADSRLLDISTAGVVGADRITKGLPLYVLNDAHGDTYGPVNYLMYVPFEAISPYTPANGAGPAARKATLAFDLLTLAGLFVLGCRLRAGRAGRRLGVILAYAWAAFPYTSLVIASNTNDALVPLFVVWGLVFVNAPPARGLFAGLGAMAKFAPLSVAPILIGGREPYRPRKTAIAAIVFAVVCAALVYALLPAGGLREFWDTTLGFQLSRESPLSLWVRDPGLDWLRSVMKATVVVVAVMAALTPRQRTVGQLAALCGAVLALTQIPANYWIYFYIVWFAPFLFIALFEEYRELGPAAAGVSAEVHERLREPGQDVAPGLGHDDQVLDPHAEHAG